MTINITITHQWPQGQPGGITVRDLHETETRITKTIMAKVSTLKEQLDGIAAQAAKANTEVKAKLAELNTKIDDLTSQLGDVEIPEDAQASLDALKGIVKDIDDNIPDAPVEPPAQG